MRRLIYLLPLFAFMAVATYFWTSLQAGDTTRILPSAMVNKPAPEFDLASLSGGKKLDLDALKGHPFVVNFFASWCVPCRIEHPLLMRLADQDHLPLYGIAYKDRPQDTQQLLSTYGDPYRVVGMDENGDVGLNFGVYGVPETYVVDSTGRIRKRFVGPLTAETVNRELLPLLKQLEPSS